MNYQAVIIFHLSGTMLDAVPSNTQETISYGQDFTSKHTRQRFIPNTIRVAETHALEAGKGKIPSPSEIRKDILVEVALNLRIEECTVQIKNT